MRNSAPFVSDCLGSVLAQSIGDWTMLVRDDGSSDGTADAVADIAATDRRITLLHRGAPSLGAAGGFNWLLAQTPDAAEAVAFIDGDDAWLNDHLAASLAAMHAADPSGRTPLLVHGDLEVVDAALQPVAPSLWAMFRLSDTPADFRRTVVSNPVTGSTIVMNRALVQRIRGRSVEGAMYQDSWFAIAGAALGRLVPRREVTVRYRQHGGNTIGAYERPAPTLTSLLRDATQALSRREAFREDVRRTAAQAAAFLLAYDDLLSADQRQFLRDWSAVPTQGWLGRAYGIATLRKRPERTWLQLLGEIARA